MLYLLLKKLIRTAAGRTRFLLAVVGLSVALLLILSAVQVQSDYNDMLHSKTNQDSIANFLVLNKVLNNQTIGSTALTAADITDLRKQSFVENAGVLTPSRFKASIQSYSNRFPFYTDISFESVPSDFIDVSGKSWRWDSFSPIIPIIIPNMFLDFYNFQFSFSQNLPQLTQDVVKMIVFKVNIITPRGPVSFNGQVVGFSDRITSLLVPEEFMTWANTRYGNLQGQQPSRIVIRTKDPGDPALVNYLRQNGLTTDADKTRFSKYRQIVNTVVSVSWVTGAVMLLFALLIFTLFIQLTIASCKEEITLLVTLGAAPAQLQRFLMKQFFPSNVLIVAIALAIISGLQWIVQYFLQGQNIFVHTFISLPTILTAVLVLAVLWFTDRWTIGRYIGGIPVNRLSSLAPLLLFFLPLSSFGQNPIPAIGNWREHLNYQAALQVLKGDKIYCATASDLFSVDGDHDVQRYSKVTGLNDIGVSCIAWDSVHNAVVIAYNNSNVDVLKGSIVTNLGDIQRSAIAGNKTIYNIFCSGGLAYFSSGLGVIVADLTKFEIRDTWLIGSTGSQVRVNGFTTDGAFYYAATTEGLKKAGVQSDPSNFINWISAGSVNNGGGSFDNVVFSGGSVVAQKNDSLYVQLSGSWSLLYADTSWPIVNITSSSGRLMVSQRKATGASRVLQLNLSGTIEKNLSQAGIISYPRSAITDGNMVWVADFFGGLSSFGSSVQRYIPNGPPGTASGDLVFNHDTLYAAAGSVDDAWNYQYNRNGVYIYSGNTWTDEGSATNPALDSTLDFIALATDPRDASLWAGSYGGGLVNFRNASAVIYKSNNSTLQPAIGDPLGYRVSGLAFDSNNNLWVSNYGAPQDLQVRKADGTWKAFTIPFIHIENAVSQIVADDANQLWIVSPRGNGVFCYNPGSSIDAITDDQWKYLQSGAGHGNLPSNNVFCIAKDKDGFIWIGTDQGIAVVQCAPDIFAQPCDAVLPVVQEGPFAGYLFHDQQVQCIAVDGANRKWVGTKNGAWLISPEGNQVIYQFTQDNSPLLSNDVKKIAIDPRTGEVFFATFQGICSFRSTATEAAADSSRVLVFPNPVPPGYNGTIAIRGLADNSLVRIAELSGRLVYETRSLGGQAIWNGLNYKGEKVASGIYLVLSRNDDGTEKIVSKVVIVSGRIQ